MGNYIFRSPINRKNLQKMLMLMPKWMVPASLSRDMPLALPNAPENDDDDKSSNFGNMCKKRGNDVSNTVTNKRRMTISSTDIRTLTQQLDELKDAVALLVSQQTIANDNEKLEKNDENKDWKQIHNAENFNRRKRCKSFMVVKENIIVEEPLRPNLKEVLKDLRNVKLRPVSTSTPKFEAKNDVRSDLHRILFKRYSSMHSPMNTGNNNKENASLTIIDNDIRGYEEIDSYDVSDDVSADFEEKWL